MLGAAAAASAASAAPAAARSPYIHAAVAPAAIAAAIWRDGLNTRKVRASRMQRLSTAADAGRRRESTAAR